MAYAASKAEVSAMVLNLAPELAGKGIAINAIAPGGTATDMASQYAPKYTHPALSGLPSDAVIGSMNALGRLVEPPEIAAVAAFLLSPEASYITGATIDAAGGWILHQCAPSHGSSAPPDHPPRQLHRQVWRSSSSISKHG
jgi:NAD(P)-dependent dehydrogenase (short-subunit alcohol dehydrogenase family)